MIFFKNKISILNKMETSKLNDIIINAVKTLGPFEHQIRSMNDFYTEGIHVILTKIFKIEKTISNARNETEEDKKISTIKFELTFTKVDLKKPLDEGRPIFPSDCRMKDKSYFGDLSVDLTIRATAFYKNGGQKVKEDKLENFKIAELPIMTGSEFCHTYGMTREALIEVGEDPKDPQGIFIIGGTEWIIKNYISRKYNIWHVFHNETRGEHARAEFISLPGDSFENSSEIILKYTMNDEITITLTSDKYFKNVELPFFVVLVLFGICDDKSMIDNIDSSNPQIRSILARAFTIHYKDFNYSIRAIKNHNELKTALIQEIAAIYVNKRNIVGLNEKEKELNKTRDVLNIVLMQNFDNCIFPHEGKAPENRFKKAILICQGIRRLLECYFDIIPSTDRDSQEMKRIQPAGDSFAKMFKKEFNSSIVNSFRNELEALARSSSFENIDLVNFIKSTTRSNTLQKNIIANLNTGMGEREVNGVKQKNRTPSENVKRKNNLQNFNNGTIQTSSNSSQVFGNERNREIREVKADQIGRNCVFQTAEGKQVGMNLNTCLGLIVSKSSSSEIMRDILIKSGLIIKYNEIKGTNYELTKIFVNGYWLGYIEKPSLLYKTFVARRRGWNLDGTRIKSDIMERKITINWNKDIDFRTDRGRGLIPMVVVYNNLEPIGQKLCGKKGDAKTGKGFEQFTLLTETLLDELRLGEKTIEDLFDEGIIDYIDAEELRMVVCAENPKILEENKNNFYLKYTHLFIPATLISIVTAYTPFVGTSSPTRSSLAGSHIKNACGDYAYNFDKRFDKLGYQQDCQEIPLISTVANHLVKTNGQNPLIIVESGEENQEDSLSACLTHAQRGIFSITKFTFEKVICDKDEMFVSPDPNNTEGLKREKNYSKLDQRGFIRKGVKVVKGDIIVGKIFKTPELTKNGKSYVDTSVSYDSIEEAYVHEIVEGIDSNQCKFVKIRFEIHRELSVGQKMATRTGQKGMIAKIVPECDMPFTSEGRVATFIINAHAFHSRLTFNYLNEAFVSNLAVLLGISIDASISVAINPILIGQQLHDLGKNRYSMEIIYNPKTGQPLAYPVFMGNIYYSRLQKFYQESFFSIGNYGPKQFVTDQPVSGKAKDGGLKLGEMEKDCFHSNGNVKAYNIKLWRNCDGIKRYFCENCGYEAIGNEKEGILICKKCGPYARVIEKQSRTAPILVNEHMKAMGTMKQFITEPFAFYDEVDDN